ncbi:2-phosphosulfolactate phosphatase [Candidatus Woesebacteria bacterium]|nr:2-phosphosulfolactate phosphatase [Candidatus Woesebacteria bacterium]MCD8507563.1 2-phosphosulfolactate phosphatase [Candidatus Woesebacteria bacterium]MCD8527404.1 2-phosphosulfolactate phosphatase [Candidatus Woesebacteria bacterium]MCD8546150.1 2-phosphosulfolactate phosphatase [Candidatus Woesebacteria bacterium]
MRIQIIPGIHGAQQATDIAVIIDVLRAASVAAYLLDAGVTSILPVSTAEEAFQLKNDDTTLLVGENKGIIIPGFDLGNSPSEILRRNDLDGKTVIHRSSTGTQGLVNAKQAQEILFGSFVMAGALVSYLQQFPDREITIVPMDAYDDHMFALSLYSALLGEKSLSFANMKNTIAQYEWIQTHFLDPNNEKFPEEDFHLCLQESIFDFFPVVRDGRIVKSGER